MKKTIIATLVFVMMFGLSVSAQDMNGLMLISGYGGYTLGFGEYFDSQEILGVEYSSSAGINLGGIFHYGVSEKMAIGGELYMQSYKAEVSGSQTLFGQTVTYDESESEMEANFLANGILALTDSEESSIAIMGGAGLYEFGDSEIGFHGGVMWRKMLSPQLDLLVTPRVHVVMADETVMLLQLSAGVTFVVGRE